MKGYLILIALSFQHLLTAQNAEKIWYFGDHAGLDFSGGAPVPIFNSAMHTYDGSSTISDKNANLLFYTNGEQIWNKSHQVMFNGDFLNGSKDCMHPSTIVKVSQGQTILYYVFTNANVGLSKGLQYSIVDMTKQNGLGEVIQKNIFIRNNLTEKVVAIPHVNHCDTWIVCHELGSNRFLAYLLSFNGISTPVTSDVGPTQPYGSPFGDGAQGQIAASPDGSMIALGNYSLDEYDLFKFDNTTGLVSNPIILDNFSRAWGVEFSSDGKKLYTSQWTLTNIYQFDLSNYNQLAILASAYLLGNVSGPNPVYSAGMLQLGPDDKIYIAKWNSYYLTVIDKPNLLGDSSNLIDNGIYLGGQLSQAGLCYFTKIPRDTSFKKSTSIANLLGNDTSLCEPINLKLSVNIPCPVWFDNSMNQTITITKAGTYWVKFEDCNTIYSDTLHVSPLKIINTNLDLSACDSTVVNGVSYKQSGNYIQNISRPNQCDSILTINFTRLQSSTNDLFQTSCDSAIINGKKYTQSGNYTQILKNSIQCDSILSIHLNLTTSNSNNLIKSSCDSVIINGQTYKQSGSYTQILKNSNQCDSILTINFQRLQNTSYNLTQTSCDSAIINGKKYIQSGNYRQILKNTNQCDSILTINLNLTNSNSFNLTKTFCDSITINGQSYNQSGNYSQTLKNSNSCDSILNLKLSLLSSSASNLTFKSCDSISINGIKYYSSGTFLQTTINNMGCDSILNLGITINGSTSVSLEAGKDTSICEGEFADLNAMYAGSANYLWQSGNGYFNNPDSLHTSYYPSTIGDHLLYFSSINECIHGLDSLTIHVLPKQIVQVTGDTIIDPCKEITFIASGGTNYSWTPASLIECLDTSCSKVRLKSQGSVNFTISTNGPCVVPASLNLSLKQIQSDIYVPNVFSPNGDNINDLFLPFVFCDKLDYYNLQIFDRWGNLVFESNDKDKGWNGIFNSDKMNPGVFAYIIQYQFPGSARKIKSGDVTLVR